jgi:signal transduction histidine kinase
MGGDLVLDAPAPGHGATFRLTLPGEPASEA